MIRMVFSKVVTIILMGELLGMGCHQAVQSVPPPGIVLMGFFLIWVKGLRF